MIRKHFEATYPDSEIVGQEYVIHVNTDSAPVVAKILASQADIVVNMINGEGNLNFYGELYRQGVLAKQLPVIATNIGEDELRGFLPDMVEGHFSCLELFSDLEDAAESTIGRRIPNRAR